MDDRAGPQGERDRVRASIRSLLEADRTAGARREVDHYKGLFPGFWDLVAEEYRGPEAPPAAGTTAVGGGARGQGADGSRIGPYRILRELGQGGMGVVYEAQDTRLPRRVALKVLSPQFASSPQFRLRFEREAAIAAKLDHPGICSVIEAGEAQGAPYIAMRFVDGNPLAELIAADRGAGEGRRSGTVRLHADGPDAEEPLIPSDAADSRRDVDRVLSLFEKAARALHVAHEKGLVHRDIKPHNVMVTSAGDPVLLDFGLAREADGEGHGLTQTGSLLGTPSYMSPEQLLAQRIQLDRRTDVYSLGVSLYESLTLRLPFEAPTVERLYQKILATEPEDPRRLNPAVPVDLKVVLETAMDKDRDRRYQTALDLAEELRRVRVREPIRARPAGNLLRLRRWTQRNRALAASLAAVLLVLVAGLAATTFLLSETTRERDAKANFIERMRDDAHLKAALLEQFRHPVQGRRVRVFPRTVIHEPSREVFHQPVFLPGAQRFGALVRTVQDRWGINRLRYLAAWTFSAWDLDGNPSPSAVRWTGTGWRQAQVAATGDRFAVFSDEAGASEILDVEGRARVALPGKQDEGEWLGAGDGFLAMGPGQVTLYGADGVARGSFAHPGASWVRGRASPGGTRVVTFGHAGNRTLKARIWDVSGTLLKELDGPPGTGAVRWVDEERLLFLPPADSYGGPPPACWILDRAGTALRSLGEPGHVPFEALPTADGRKVVTQDWTGRVQILDMAGGPPVTLPVQVQPCYCPDNWPRFEQAWGLRLSPKGDVVAALRTKGSNRLSLWSMEGEELAVLPWNMPATDARFSPEGDRILVSDGIGSLVLWEILRESR